MIQCESLGFFLLESRESSILLFLPRGLQKKWFFFKPCMLQKKLFWEVFIPVKFLFLTHSFQDKGSRISSGGPHPMNGEQLEKKLRKTSLSYFFCMKRTIKTWAKLHFVYFQTIGRKKMSKLCDVNVPNKICCVCKDISGSASFRTGRSLPDDTRLEYVASLN